MKRKKQKQKKKDPQEAKHGPKNVTEPLPKPQTEDFYPPSNPQNVR